MKDLIAAVLSGLCVVHCLAMPLLLVSAHLYNRKLLMQRQEQLV